MKSIKEYNTTGMCLLERYQLFEQVEPIQIGEIVYRAGDFASWTEPVKVTKENQKEITMFWNCIYFDNEKQANNKTSRAHAAYGEYQAEASNLWYAANCV